MYQLWYVEQKKRHEISLSGMFLNKSLPETD